MIPRMVVPVLLLLTLSPAWGGEIVFVDPIREKAKLQTAPVDARSRTQDSLEHSLESARDRAGRGRTVETIYLNDTDNPVVQKTPAAERAGAVRDYLDDTSPSPQVIILKSGPPPSDAAKSRQSARSWTSTASSTSTSDRCKTENTVGGVEGQPQGHTVIQSVKGSVTVCK